MYRLCVITIIFLILCSGCDPDPRLNESKGIISNTAHSDNQISNVMLPRRLFAGVYRYDSIEQCVDRLQQNGINEFMFVEYKSDYVGNITGSYHDIVVKHLPESFFNISYDNTPIVLDKNYGFFVDYPSDPVNIELHGYNSYHLTTNYYVRLHTVDGECGFYVNFYFSSKSSIDEVIKQKIEYRFDEDCDPKIALEKVMVQIDGINRECYVPKNESSDWQYCIRYSDNMMIGFTLDVDSYKNIAFHNLNWTQTENFLIEKLDVDTSNILKGYEWLSRLNFEQIEFALPIVEPQLKVANGNYFFDENSFISRTHVLCPNMQHPSSEE